MGVEILEGGLERLSRRNQPVQIGALAREHGLENLPRRVILAAIARESVGQADRRIWFIAVDPNRARPQWREPHRPARRQRSRGNRAEVFVHQLHRRRAVDVADDHVDRIVGMIPGVVERAQLRRVDLRVEGAQRAQAVVAIGGAGKHREIDLQEEAAHGVAVVLSDLVLDRAPLDLPVRLRERETARPRRLHSQQQIQILRRRHEEELRDLRLRVGVPVAAEQLGDVGDLRLRERGAASEHHVLERVCLPREVLIVGAGLIVEHRHRHRRERIAHRDDSQAVSQGCASNRKLGARRPHRAGNEQKARTSGDREATEKRGCHDSSLLRLFSLKARGQRGPP